MYNVILRSEFFVDSLKIYDIARGIIPLSTYRSAPPVIVNVFPLPVCPYANIVELKPANAEVTLVLQHHQTLLPDWPSYRINH